jgi:hypothetical protein
MFLYSLIVAVLSFAAAAELNTVPIQLDGINISGLLVLFGAVYVFLAGIGTSGWIRSKVAGIFTTVFCAHQRLPDRVCHHLGDFSLCITYALRLRSVRIAQTKSAPRKRGALFIFQ